MAFLPSLSPLDLHHYHRAIAHSASVRSHFDAFVWLQGDMQRFLPHEILIAAWGNFHESEGAVQHDIISALPGVRSKHSNPETINPLLLRLYNRWHEFGCKPFTLNVGEDGFLLHDTGLECALGTALQTMRCALVHGINDERGSHDCLYVTFSRKDAFTDVERSTMGLVLPYIDIALRQIEHLPHQAHAQPEPVSAQITGRIKEIGLSVREAEVLHWVTLGKTNPEIGSILEISEFTVKNHMQRVFKKLDVSNRAQAVGKLRSLVSHV